MTLMERARARTPISWLTVVGLLLLPVVIGGVLIAALNTPTDRLENMTAAIVNDDEPVTVDGQYTPLGRQLAAGLVEGADDESNLTWVLSNDDDAAEGIADGRYQAVVTIPENFSAAAMSPAQRLSGDDEEAPERAKIDVATAPNALMLDQAIADQLANVATNRMGTTLTEGLLSNVLVGFGSMGDQLGTAADGAQQLADGARDAQDGAGELGEGATQLADGIGTLGDGVSQLADGAGSASAGAQELAGGAGQLAGSAPALTEGANGVSNGASELADGASGLTDGADGLSNGASGLADGIDRVEAGVTGDGGLVDGAEQLSGGIDRLRVGLDGDGTSANPGLVAGADGLAGGLADGVQQIRDTDLVPDEMEQAAAGAADGAAGVSSGLQGLVDACGEAPAPAYCAEIGDRLGELNTAAAGTSEAASGVRDGLGQIDQAPAQMADELQPSVDGAAQLADGAHQLSDGAAGLSDGASQLADGAKQLGGGLPALSDGAHQLSDGAGRLSDGTMRLGDGAAALAGGASQLADGTRQFGDGANALATGASGLADGVGQLATGAGQAAAGAPALQDGATQVADGVTELGDGIGKLGDGAGDLSSGLGQAVDELPSLSKAEAEDVADVAADPVTASSDTGLFGAAAIPLLAVAVLWFGALATFLVLRALPGGAVVSRRSSVALAAGSLLPAAVIGAVQGALVAVIVQIAADYDAGIFWGLAGMLALTGVAFAAIHQALAAAFGGVGRWIAGIVGALAVALGVISTVPEALRAVRPLLPTTPAFDGLVSVITGTAGVGAAAMGLLVWAALTFAVTAVAVSIRRGAGAKALLSPRPAR